MHTYTSIHLYIYTSMHTYTSHSTTLHRLRRLLCSQMPVPPHSLHWLRTRLWPHSSFPITQTDSLLGLAWIDACMSWGPSRCIHVHACTRMFVSERARQTQTSAQLASALLAAVSANSWSPRLICFTVLQKPCEWSAFVCARIDASTYYTSLLVCMLIFASV